MMLSSASLVAALLLAASFGPANPRGPSATRPTSRPAVGATVDLSQLDGPERLRRTPVQRSPELTALVASALRHYAEGATPSGPLETAIAKSLNRTRGGKGIVAITVRDFDEGPDYGAIGGGLGGSVPCGDPPGPAQYAPCPDSWDVLDFHSGPYDWSALLSVDPTTGKITGTTTGNVGEELTLMGAGAPRGKVKVVITVE